MVASTSEPPLPPNYELYAKKRILAPMVRGGRTPLRLLALRYGADLVYTEEIVAQKLLSCKRSRNDVLKTVDYMIGDDVVLRVADVEKDRCVLQIGVNNGEDARRVAEMVGTDVAAIDVNMGCPKPFSVHQGMGSALLTQPDRIEELFKILTALVSAARVPVSCKIRVLHEREDTLSLVRRIAACGVSALGVHGRRKEERRDDKCRIEEIAEVAKALPELPIICNGASTWVQTLADVDKFREDCGASSVMIARKGLVTPSVFRKEGVLPMVEDIENFLKLACDYDENFTMTKYVVQRILGGEQERDPRGRETIAAGSVLELCRAWSLGDYWEKCTRERRAAGGLKRRCVEVDDAGVHNLDVSFPLKKLKTSTKGGESPKCALMFYSEENKEKKPEYSTEFREGDRRFVGSVVVGGKTYRSRCGQVSKKMAEQVAALAALIALGERKRLQGDWEELME